MPVINSAFAILSLNIDAMIPFKCARAGIKKTGYTIKPGLEGGFPMRCLPKIMLLKTSKSQASYSRELARWDGGGAAVASDQGTPQRGSTSQPAGQVGMVEKKHKRQQWLKK